MEGVRMRTAYSRASRQYNVAWNGRRYDTANWGKGDPINRALSAANALLNGICHSAIVSGGYSPGIGFIHTGRQLSFVYDIADLYKTELTIPLAFKIVGESPHNVESRVRQACRELFHTSKLLSRLLPDIDEVLGIPADYGMSFGDPDSAAGEPVELWEALWAGEEG
jgi:CRISPR-associated protein Cas1